MNWIEKMIAEQCPNGVEYVKLGDIFHVQNGYTPSKANKSFWENGTIPWIRLDDIRKNGRILTDSIQHITHSAIKKGRTFKAGSIIITTTATIGEYALVDCDFICNQQITCLSPLSKNINNHFFLHYAAIIGEWCKQNVNGAGLAILPTSKLKECLIPLPPLSIQEEIVSVLDKFSELIEKTDAEIALRQKQYEYYREKLLTFEDGEVEWDVLGKVCNVVRGASPRPISEFLTSNGGTPWIKIGDVGTESKYVTQTNEFITSEGVKKSRFLRSGSFILSNSMSFGRPYILKIDGCIHDGWIALSDYENSLCSDYLYELLKSNKIQYYWKKKVNNGGAMSNLNSDIVSGTPIPLPSPSRQQEIVATLDKFEALISKLKEERELRQKQYEYYREKLLTF